MKLKQPDIKGFSVKENNSKAKITPMMAQYLEVKNRHQEYLLFYRMGDFYELFFDDAKKAANCLGIALTKRGKLNDKDIPMCGVPAHSAQTYLSRLIKADFKVAIAEQLEPDKNDQVKNPKIFKRDVVKIITPGTILDESLLNSKSNNHLISIHHNKGEICLSWVDMSTGVIKYQFFSGIHFQDDLSEVVEKIEPQEIIIEEFSSLNTYLEDKSKFYEKKITKLSDSFFDEKNNKEKLKKLTKLLSLAKIEELREVEISSIGALYSYLELTQKNNIPNLNKIKKIEKKDYLQIDNFSEKSLEIFQKTNGEKKGCLLDTIDSTKTSSGSRLLREFLKNPEIDKKIINFRHDCVQSFIDDKNLLTEIRTELTGLPDGERALSRISAFTNNPRDTIMIQNFIEKAESVFAKIISCSQDKLKSLIPDTKLRQKNLKIKELIFSHIQEPPPINLNNGGAIKNSVSNELDNLRNIKTVKRKKILELQIEYSKITGINNLKIKFNNFHGYFIEVTNKNLDKIENSNYKFNYIQKTVNNVRFSTEELSQISKQILDSEELSIELEKKIYKQLCCKINDSATTLSVILEKISFIDVMLSFAYLSSERDYTRPKIDDKKIIKLNKARHPVVEEGLRTQGGEFSSNDCFLNEKETTWLMTGPNMAGKSTFLRQTVIIIIMNQIGCFVPAESATLSIFDKIFTRIGASDNLSQGMSTFMTEMMETSKIIFEATENSFVILDELGRGTSSEDGFAIARAVLEFIVSEIKCITLFATHYKEICKLEKVYSQIKCKTLQIKKWNEEIIFLYKVIDGISEGSFGIHVAGLAGINEQIITKSKEILRTQKNSQENLKIEKIKFQPENVKSLKYKKVIGRIKKLKLDEITPKAAHDILYAVKKELD